MGQIDEIIALEWDFFQQTENEGGRASCQDDRRTFRIMRESQFSVWPAPLLDSYLDDLRTAKIAGRNPVEEKYARMMEATAPEAYEQLRPYLPALTLEAKTLIDEICRVHIAWNLDFAARWPALSGQARATTQEGSGVCATSMAVYLAAELATYSPRTLRLYRDFVRSLEQQGQNLTQRITEHTVRCYGYATLDEAEARYRAL